MVGVVVAVSVAAAALVMTKKLGMVRRVGCGIFSALRTGSYARGLLGARSLKGDASLLDGLAFSVFVG